MMDSFKYKKQQKNTIMTKNIQNIFATERYCACTYLYWAIWGVLSGWHMCAIHTYHASRVRLFAHTCIVTSWWHESVSWKRAFLHEIQTPRHLSGQNAAIRNTINCNHSSSTIPSTELFVSDYKMNNVRIHTKLAGWIWNTSTSVLTLYLLGYLRNVERSFTFHIIRRKGQN